MTKLLLCLLLSANCWAAPKEGKAVQPKTRTASIEGLCSFEMPASWTLEPKPYAAQTGVRGVKLSAPGSTPENPAMIYVDFYPQDNQLKVSSASYVARLSASGTLRPSGRKAGKPAKARLGPLDGESVYIESVAYYPPEAVEPRKIPVREKVVVAGAQKGFFVASCYAGKKSYAQTAAYLQTLLKTFKPVLPKP